MKLLATACIFASLLTLTACAKPSNSAEAPEFTVVTYNVENLFDVDGVAMFDDYKQDADDASSYTARKFLAKLETIAEILQTINQGAGPEVVLFQELEADFTPDSTVVDYAAFLAEHAGTSVEAMLTSDFDSEFAGVPASAWLLKALSDAGMTGYEVVTVPSRGMDSGIAHTNAVFSKFPIRGVERHALDQARDVLEAELDVLGHPLIVYVNHWKSGASNPKREPIRVGNAKVLRGLIDARLAANPQADILVAGDLNSHYNHSILFPDITTGINDVLGSSGDERFVENDLYNLWFELPPEARYTEVWRGRRGSLMHKLVTPGLYDATGISYVDGSFEKLVIPGLNADQIGRPLEWHGAGETGGGASDHFPILARFTVAPFEASGELSLGDDALDFEMPLNVAGFSGELDLKDGRFLNELSDAELASYVAQLYTVEATVLQIDPLRLQVGDRVWPAYYADPKFVEVGGLPDFIFNHEGKVRLIVQPNFWRGNSQLIVEAILGSW